VRARCSGLLPCDGDPHKAFQSGHGRLADPNVLIGAGHQARQEHEEDVAFTPGNRFNAFAYRNAPIRSTELVPVGRTGSPR
jgi:hypothetical protein